MSLICAKMKLQIDETHFHSNGFALGDGLLKLDLDLSTCRNEKIT